MGRKKRGGGQVAKKERERQKATMQKDVCMKLRKDQNGKSRGGVKGEVQK